MRHFSWAAPLLFAMMMAIPQAARAQYKNWSYGVDAGYAWNLQYSAFDPPTGTFTPPGNRTPRLSMGGRLGVETNYKLSSDRWWLTFRLNLGLHSFLPTTIGNAQEVLMDQEANRTLGAIFSVQGIVGMRMYFLTDRVRPYLQFGVSYAHLFSFLDTAGQPCNSSICGDGGAGVSNLGAYLAHENTIGLHVQPGLEWLFKRDMGLTVFIDPQVLFVLNAPPLLNIVVAAGLIFYT